MPRKWDKTPEDRRRDAATYGTRYRRSREAARRRARGICEGCGHAHPRLECDHIVNTASTGGVPDHSLSNLQMLCHGPGSCQCHERKTSQEANSARRGGTAQDPEVQPRTQW